MYLKTHLEHFQSSRIILMIDAERSKVQIVVDIVRIEGNRPAQGVYSVLGLMVSFVGFGQQIFHLRSISAARTRLLQHACSIGVSLQVDVADRQVKRSVV